MPEQNLNQPVSEGTLSVLSVLNTLVRIPSGTYHIFLSLTSIFWLKVGTESSRILPTCEAPFTHSISTGGMRILGTEHDPSAISLLRIEVEIDAEIE